MLYTKLQMSIFASINEIFRSILKAHNKLNSHDLGIFGNILIGIKFRAKVLVHSWFLNKPHNIKLKCNFNFCKCNLAINSPV